MFQTIMVPVDLAHAERLEKALRCAADLGRLYEARVVYVAVTTALPGKLAHNPREFAARLEAFAAEQGARHGIRAEAHAALSHDPTTDLDDTLLRVIREIHADLVVMASHIPNLADHLWPSNGGKIAGHASASVLVVRGH